MGEAKPDAVFLAAGKVGGIHANSTYPADFIADNLAIALNVIRSAYEAGVQKLLFLGSSCIFPRLAPQPITEEMLLTGPLEPTNQWYAVAKIAGIKLCEAYRLQHGADFISVMPPTFTVQGTTIILKTAMYLLLLFVVFIQQSWQVLRMFPCGALVHLAVNSWQLTTLPMHVCS